MPSQLEDLIAKRFIQRRDVKAVQLPPHGGYSPDYQLYNRRTGQKDPGRHGPLGWQRKHLTAHLSGKATYGHYILDADSRCRVITFDIDLIDNDSGTVYDFDTDKTYLGVNPRLTWQDRTAIISRIWFKYQMKMLATKFCSAVIDLGLKTAAAYTGSKGVHIYGFLEKPLPAASAHHGANLVLEMIGGFEPAKGNHLYKSSNGDPLTGFQNFTIEVYPKQTSLEGKTLGNLVRLPLGRNLKSKDPTFFLDLTTPMAVFSPHPDPVRLLEEGNPFSDTTG